MRNKEAVKKLLGLLKDYRKIIALIIACLLISTGLNMCIPLLNRGIMDYGFIGGDKELLIKQVICSLLIYMIIAVIAILLLNATQIEEEKEEEDVIDIEAKPEITFDDFGKMQFQVGEIISCEAVPKSKKLLCSQVKIGSQVRQIVSGIKAHYSPEEMVGKKVMVLVNLKPAKLAGVLSEGMILCAEDAEGNLALVTPEKNMPAGAEIC